MKPSIPKGTRDFGPVEMARRNYIFNTIRSVFELYGFQPIETPAMENLSTLTGKYGEEGDQLIFKILNSRIHDSKEKEALKKEFGLSLDSSRNSETLTEKALRYDLTVPFARYVVQHREEIIFPFKRYQIQPVWRADRPQKGRYREFFQCDADIVGSGSLLNEVELVQIIDEVFNRLGINVTIKINNRKILEGLATFLEVHDDKKVLDFISVIDKLDKISIESVKNELYQLEIKEEKVDLLFNLFEEINKLKHIDKEKFKNLDLNLYKLSSLEGLFFEKNEIHGNFGVYELKLIHDYLVNLNIKAKIEFDLTLARGLNYYTGAIFEVKTNDVEIGSISGGGRYDNLTGIFGWQGISGVGISFGADRIYDVLLQTNKFPNFTSFSTKVLILQQKDPQFPEELFENKSLMLLKELRNNGISSEIYPDLEKDDKQFNYAKKRGIPFIININESETDFDKFKIKNMLTRESKMLSISDLVDFIKK
jgi:histidyl-tRNA synthetase